jgi:hypothetical protein
MLRCFAPATRIPSNFLTPILLLHDVRSVIGAAVMSKPIVVSIPHRLGREEAVRRLKSGLERARTAFGSQFAVHQEHWSGDHLDLRIALFGQATEGTIDVAEDNIRIEVQLPWFIGMLADKAKALIQRQGQLMLEKK